MRTPTKTGLSDATAKLVVEVVQSQGRRQLILRLRRSGMTLAAIGHAMGGISRQRVSQLLIQAVSDEKGTPR